MEIKNREGELEMKIIQTKQIKELGDKELELAQIVESGEKFYRMRVSYNKGYHVEIAEVEFREWGVEIISNTYLAKLNSLKRNPENTKASYKYVGINFKGMVNHL